MSLDAWFTQNVVRLFAEDKRPQMLAGNLYVAVEVLEGHACTDNVLVLVPPECDKFLRKDVNRANICVRDNLIGIQLAKYRTCYVWRLPALLETAWRAEVAKSAVPGNVSICIPKKEAS